MKTLLYILCILSVAMAGSCDFRSGIAKDNMEKYNTTPTPGIPPTAEPTPAAPVDSVDVDINQEGEQLYIDSSGQKTTKSCSKYDRLMIDGDSNKITIKGVCRQIMINGNKNEVTADAAMEFVLNGSENRVKYARLVNGKQPSVIQNQADNTVEKIAAGAMNGR